MRGQGLSRVGVGGGAGRDEPPSKPGSVLIFLFVRKGMRTFQVLVGYLPVGFGIFVVERVLRITDVQLWEVSNFTSALSAVPFAAACNYIYLYKLVRMVCFEF